MQNLIEVTIPPTATHLMPTAKVHLFHQMVPTLSQRIKLISQETKYREHPHNDWGFQYRPLLEENIYKSGHGNQN